MNTRILKSPLVPQQRLSDMAECADLVQRSDLRFFANNSYRQFLVRKAFDCELMLAEQLGEPLPPLPPRATAWGCVVRKVGAKRVTRTFIPITESADDPGEAAARAAFEGISAPALRSRDWKGAGR